ncbi:MAG: SPFH domain-containing protein [Gordonia sp. (in: high G+C Gram-positive bacteria)]|uniref:SPFH domain-containing protein n=1 Tax=Gordonia sp. (in: high G+C Gram-positive bacteria) TaxID=84139 RepID=UPI0039E56D15
MVFKKFTSQLVDIIEWLDDSRTTLAWRFPRYHNEIKNGAELIVREGQRAVFVYRGQLADEFGPGHYRLTSENLPVLSTLQGWKHGFNSPFRSEVYFLNTRPVTELRWGTANPVTIRDPDFKMVQVRANGMCVIRVDDAAVFLREVIGTDSNVDLDEVQELVRRTITLAFSDMVLQTGLGVLDLQGRQVELSEQLKDFADPRMREYGLKVQSIMLNVTLPQEITDAITRGVARGVEEQGFLDQVTDMQRYQQGRLGDAMVAGAQNPGGSSVGDFLGAGMGMAMGQQMGGMVAGPQAQQPPQPVAPPPMPTAVQYHVDQGGQAAGPFAMPQLQSMVAAGRLTAQTVVWTQGMAGWTPAGRVPELAALFDVPPPLPPQGPPPMPQS